MAKPKLTNKDFCEAARRLRCEVAAIKAVSYTESRGEGFYEDGFPVILFERHIFWKYASRELIIDPEGDGKKKIAKRDYWRRKYPHICNPTPGGYGKPGQNQRNKFNLAFSLDSAAAMKACSWGKFQIMGFNYGMCGFNSVGEFVDAMKESEGEQLLAFVAFVKSAGLADELRNHEWANFARGYNGAGYRKNQYDTKMATAYVKFSKENIDCSKVSAAVQKPTDRNLEENEQAGGGDSISSESSSNTQETATQGQPSITNQQTGEIQSETPTPSPQPETLVKERPSTFVKIFTMISGAIGTVTAFGINLSAIVQNKLEQITPAQVFYLVLGLAFVALAIWFYDRSAKRANLLNQKKIEAAQNPNLNTVELTMKPQKTQAAGMFDYRNWRKGANELQPEISDRSGFWKSFESMTPEERQKLRMFLIEGAEVKA